MHKNISCYHLSYCYERARIAQSIRSLNCGLNNQGVVVRFPSETRHIFFPTILRQALGHIQPSIQWVAGDSFAWGKAKPVLFQENGMQKTASSQKHIKKDKKHLFNYTRQMHNSYSLHTLTVFLLLPRNSCTIV